jgi:hypothetical protein
VAPVWLHTIDLPVLTEPDLNRDLHDRNRDDAHSEDENHRFHLLSGPWISDSPGPNPGLFRSEPRSLLGKRALPETELNIW